jgi:hypothetical protein
MKFRLLGDTSNFCHHAGSNISEEEFQSSSLLTGQNREDRNMTPLRLGLLAAASVGLFVSGASAQQVIMQNGQYYRLVPINRPLVGAPGAGAISPAGVAAIVPNAEMAGVVNPSCRIHRLYSGEYAPEYVTACRTY